MMFKSLARHAAVAKNLFIASSLQSQPSFFNPSNPFLHSKHNKLVPKDFFSPHNNTNGTEKNGNPHFNAYYFAGPSVTGPDVQLSQFNALDDDDNSVSQTTITDEPTAKSAGRLRRTQSFSRSLTARVRPDAGDDLKRKRRYSTSASDSPQQHHRKSESVENSNEAVLNTEKETSITATTATAAPTASKPQNEAKQPANSSPGNALDTEYQNGPDVAAFAPALPPVVETSAAETPEEGNQKGETQQSRKQRIAKASAASNQLLIEAYTAGDYNTVLNHYFTLPEESRRLISKNALHAVLRSIPAAPGYFDSFTELITAMDAINVQYISNTGTMGPKLDLAFISGLLETAFALSDAASAPCFRDVRRRHGKDAQKIRPLEVSLREVEQAAGLFEFAYRMYKFTKRSNGNLQWPPEVLLQLLRGEVLFGSKGRGMELAKRVLKLQELRYSGEAFRWVMRLCVRNGASEEAAFVFEEYKKRLSEPNSAELASVASEIRVSMVQAFVTDGKVAEAEKFVAEVAQQDPTQSNLLYSAIVSGIARSGDPQAAWDFVLRLSDAERAEITPEAIAELITACCRSDSAPYSLAKRIYNFYAPRADFSAAPQVLNSARNDYAILALSHNDTNEILHLIKEAAVRHVVWDEVTLVRIITHLLTEDALNAPFVLETFRSRCCATAEAYRVAAAAPTPTPLAALSKRTVLEAQQAIAANALTSVVQLFALVGQLDVQTSLKLADTPFFAASCATLPAVAARMLLSRFVAAKNAGELPFDATVAAVTFYLQFFSETLYAPPKDRAVAQQAASSMVQGFVQLVNDLAARPAGLGGLPDGVAAEVSNVLAMLAADGVEVPAELAQTDIKESGETVAQQGSKDVATRCATPGSVIESATASKLPTPPATPPHSAAPPSADPLRSNDIILLCRTSHKLGLALRRFEDAMAAGARLSPEAFCALIEAAGAQGLPDVARIIAAEARKTFAAPQSSSAAFAAWVALLRSVVRATAATESSTALAAYSELRSLGATPCAEGYAKLVAAAPPAAFGGSDAATQALTWLEEAQNAGVAPTTFLYNAVLAKLGKARRLRDALRLSAQMDATGVPKSSVTYGTLIAACTRAGDGATAERLFAEMEAAPNYEPKVAPFNALLQYYVHTVRDRSAALATVARLKAAKVEPSSHTYRLIMECYGELEPVNLEQADAVLQEMSAAGVAPGGEHYAVLIRARGVALKRLDAAFGVYKLLTAAYPGGSAEKSELETQASARFKSESAAPQEQPNWAIRPTAPVFQALLESCVANRAMRETAQVMREMARFGVELDAYMANVLIRGWAAEDLPKAEMLFDYVVAQQVAEPSTFESMARAYVYWGHSEAAKKIVAFMRERGYPGPVVARVESVVAEMRRDVTVLEEKCFVASQVSEMTANSVAEMA